MAQATRRAQAQRDRIVLVEVLRVQAMLLARQERWSDAAGALEEGLILARSMPYPYAEARLLHVYGQLYVQQGSASPARERLEAASAIFRRLGARKHTEQVEQAIRTLTKGCPAS